MLLKASIKDPVGIALALAILLSKLRKRVQSLEYEISNSDYTRPTFVSIATANDISSLNFQFEPCISRLQFHISLTLPFLQHALPPNVNTFVGKSSSPCKTCSCFQSVYPSLLHGITITTFPCQHQQTSRSTAHNRTSICSLGSREKWGFWIDSRRSTGPSPSWSRRVRRIGRIKQVRKERRITAVPRSQPTSGLYSGIELRNKHPLPPGMIDGTVQRVVEQFVECDGTEKWRSIELASPSLKFKVHKHFLRPISSTAFRLTMGG